jgi:hypothetical protein
MKTEHLVQALEAAVAQLGVQVRRERGAFRGGLCTVDGATMVILNRRHPAEVHLAILAAVLRELPVEQIYLRPAVRDALERLWEAPEAAIPDLDVGPGE